MKTVIVDDAKNTIYTPIGITAPIVSGLGDEVPEQVSKGSGSNYAIAPKAVHFLKNKASIFKYLDKKNTATISNYRKQYCTYIPDDKTEVNRITNHELIFRILENSNAYNNFRNHNCNGRTPQDIANFLEKNKVRGIGLTKPNMPEFVTYEYKDPIDLLPYEMELLPVIASFEKYLEQGYWYFKNPV